MVQESEVYARLTEIFNDVFLRHDIVLIPALTAKGIEGWDSFKQIEIIIAVEEHYKIKFHTRELDNLKSVGDLASQICKKLNAKA